MRLERTGGGLSCARVDTLLATLVRRVRRRAPLATRPIRSAREPVRECINYIMPIVSVNKCSANTQIANTKIVIPGANRDLTTTFRSLVITPLRERRRAPAFSFLVLVRIERGRRRRRRRWSARRIARVQRTHSRRRRLKGYSDLVA